MSITDQHLIAYIDMIFSKYDHDRSGFLEVTQLYQFLNDANRATGIPYQISPQQAQQSLAAMDKDFNGRVSKEQLYYSFKQIYTQQGMYVNNQQMNQNMGYNYNQTMNSWVQNQYNNNNSPNFNQAQKQFTNTYVNQPVYGAQFVQQSTSQPVFGSQFVQQSTSQPIYGAQFVQQSTSQPVYGSQFVQKSVQQMPNTYAAQQLAMGQTGNNNFDTNQMLRQQFQQQQQQNMNNNQNGWNIP